MTRPHKNCDISPSHVDLRDTFAAAALTGLLAAPTDKDRSMEYWARLSYEAADAMLRERERGTEPPPKEKRAEVADDDEQPVRLKNGWWYPKAKNQCPPPPPPPPHPFPAPASRQSETRQTNHDAAPAARAEPLERGTRREGQGTGDIPCSRTRDIVARLRKWCHAVDAESAQDLMDEAADEIASLRNAIRRLADQDATLSVQGGSVTVTMDATLSDEEREAVEWAAEVIPAMAHPSSCSAHIHADTLRSLLERLK